MRILALFLSIMTLSVFANANICSPAWLAGAGGGDVTAFVRAGEDPNQTCSANGNTPLHQALLSDRVDASVIEALVNAGGDLYAQNIHRETPMGYAQDRFDRVRATYPASSSIYRVEQALYSRIFGDTSSNEADAAHDQLCDLGWWRSSASGPAVQRLLNVRGVDPDHTCNFNNDRIIHQPLKLASFTLLTENIFFGIKALVDGGADLYVRNDSSQSAVSLAEIRYDRVRDRIIQNTVSWCNRQMTGQQFGSKLEENAPDQSVYLYITSSATNSFYDQLFDKSSMEHFNTTGLVEKRVVCPYRGIHNYR